MEGPRREDCRYASCYCEENVWHLSDRPLPDADERWALFISNPHRSCAMWQQRAAPPGQPVVWDYHVVLVTQGSDRIQVWDLDSRLLFPCSLDEWLAGSFPHQEALAARLRPVFRLVPAGAFRNRFRSDRSHMRRPDGSWLAPPPDWPPIGEGTNLARFIDMEHDFLGTVHDLPDLYRRF